MKRIAVVLPLLAVAAGCGEPAPPSSVPPPPPYAGPRPPGVGDFARQSFRAPLSVDDAERILIRTSLFEFGNMPPKRQVQAFNLLLDQPDAVARFHSIAARGETAGKLYALCAFLALNSRESITLESSLSNDGTRLQVFDSDVVRLMTAAEAVLLIRQRDVIGWMRREKEETTRYFVKAGLENDRVP